MHAILLVLAFHPAAIHAEVAHTSANSTDFSNWDITPYNTGVYRSKGKHIEIVGEQAPAGIFFIKQDLDSAKVYRLEVAGESIEGTATLRTRLDDQTPTYARAPTGVFTSTIEQTGRLELLFYADLPFEYLLEKIALSQCDSCLTDTQLRAQLLRDLPQLEQALVDDRHLALNLLLEWAANQADLGTDPDWVAKNTTKTMSWSAAQIYDDILEPNQGGLWCGGKSVFFSKLVRMFGFDSFTINFGIVEDGLNHVTTIVPMWENDGWRFLNLDATFNVTFWENQHQMHDVLDLLGAHRKNKIPNAYERQGDVSKMEHLVTLDRLDGNRCPHRVAQQDGFWVCHNPEKDFQYTFSSMNSWGALLPRHNFSKGTAGYFDLMFAGLFSIGPTKNLEAKQAFISGLRDLGISIQRP